MKHINMVEAKINVFKIQLDCIRALDSDKQRLIEQGAEFHRVKTANEKLIKEIKEFNQMIHQLSKYKLN